MKANLTYILAAVLSLSLVSCTKENTYSTTTLKISVPADDSKVWFKDGKVQWATEDKIIVFDDNYGKKVSDKAGTSNEVYHEFTVPEWPSERTPSYAVFSCSAYATPYADAQYDGSNIGVILPQAQNVRNTNSFSQHAVVSVGKVTLNEGVFNVPMKNVNGLLKFALSNADIKSVEISSVENVDIAGKITIAVSSVEAGAPAFEVVEGEKSIVLTCSGSAANEGCFKSTGFYLASVLPGTFTPVITLKNKDGLRSCVRTASSAVTVHRNGIFDLGTIDSDLKWDINLEFHDTNNPFVGITNTPLAAGDTFTMKGFTFTSIGTSGWYWDKALWNTVAGYLKLPEIEGFALKSVTLAGGNASGKPVFITYDSDGHTATGGARQYIALTDLGEATGIDANNAVAEATWNVSGSTAYYIRTTTAKTKIVKMILVYSQTNQ